MDAENEKLVHELMKPFHAHYYEFISKVPMELAIREAISRTQEDTRKETLLEAAELATYTRPVGWHVTAADLIRMTEAPNKPSPEVKQIAS